jgi:hypothetical protein
MRKLALVVAVSMGVASQAAAADMSSALLTSSATAPSGAVLVSRDGRFTPALGGKAVLRKGDRVVLKAGEHASLTFPDGCVVQLAPGAMATVGATSPCANANGGYQQTAFAPGGIPPVYIAALGGVAIVGSYVGASGVASGQGSSTPHSP